MFNESLHHDQKMIDELQSSISMYPVGSPSEKKSENIILKNKGVGTLIYKVGTEEGDVDDYIQYLHKKLSNIESEQKNSSDSESES